MVYAQESILNYNLHGNPARPWPVLVAVVVASAALVAGTLGVKRGQDLPSGHVLAEENSR
jgi:hypothetical protein